MLECKNSKKYNAKQPPKCEGGRGCESCRAKYAAVARARARKAERIRSK